MKNKILLGLAASSLVASAAMADVYVGVEYGAASNTEEWEWTGASNGTREYDNDYRDIKLKIGGGEDGGVKVQATLSFIKFDDIVFDATNKDYIEVGVDLIKEFEVNKNVYPFIKGGLGVGSMDVEGYNQSSILAVSVNVGAGVSFKATDNFYFVGGIDYVYRDWQDIEYTTGLSTTTVNMTNSALKPYIGANFKF
ncbi:MAG: outer membrane protein [Sulfuricurvum sp.]